MLERERFDVLHFHEPFVPFLSLMLLRESQSINVATFHAYAGWSPAYEFGKRALQRFARRLHGRIAVSAAARHFIDRYFPGDYKVIPNGVDLTRLRHVQPIARYRDGTLNILFLGRFESRKGAMYLLKAYRLLRKRGFDCRLLMVGTGPAGARDPALHRDAPADRRRAARTGQRRRQGALLRHGRRVRLAGHRPRELRHRPARGNGRRQAHRVQRHPRLQGRGPPRRAGAARSAARRQGTHRGARDACSAIAQTARADGARRARARAAVQLGEHHRQGRGLLPLRRPARRCSRPAGTSTRARRDPTILDRPVASRPRSAPFGHVR